MSRRYSIWEEPEMKKLIFLILDGRAPKEIAKILKKDVSSIYTKQRALGLTQKRLNPYLKVKIGSRKKKTPLGNKFWGNKNGKN